MTNERLLIICRRLVARLPDVKGLTLELGPSAEAAVAVLVVDEAGVVRAHILLDSSPTDDQIVDEACEIEALGGGRVLPEVVLSEDVALCLNGHEVRIAELQRAVRSAPRPPVDHSQPYSVEEAEADIQRVALLLRESSGVDVHETTAIRASRIEAARLLSRLKGWNRGAPPTSAGHHYARLVFEDNPAPVFGEAG